MASSPAVSNNAAGAGTDWMAPAHCAEPEMVFEKRRAQQHGDQHHNARCGSERGGPVKGVAHHETTIVTPAER
jgi:hypothetical protein